MKKVIKTICLVLAVIMSFSCVAFSADTVKAKAVKALRETMTDMEKLLSETGAEFGNEWMIMDLALYGSTNSSIFDTYYKSVEAHVAAVVPGVKVDGAENALDKNKSTENSRLIIALSAMGKYATAVGGYDLTKPFESFKWISRMGHMGPVWTLLAFDTFGYETKDKTIRQQCVDYLIDAQLASGGWDLARKSADVDVTAMTLQALYPYRGQAEVKAAADKAFKWLSDIQAADGGFSSWGTDNSESCAQVIVACCTWGIDPSSDSRFVKKGHSAVENLLTFRVKDSKNGWGFAHVMESATTGGMSYVGGEYNAMATEQAAYALIAFDKFVNNQKGLYDMSAQKPFTDIKGNSHQADIEYCCNVALMKGVGNQQFDPNGSFTRAMLVTTMYRLAGSPAVKGFPSFTDIPGGAWYADALKWAEDKGIAGGYGNGRFGPEDDITVEQIWVFLYRFAKVMGYDIISSSDISCFSDAKLIDSWAIDAAKWAAANKMILKEDGRLNPASPANRALSAMYLARFDIYKAEFLIW